MADITVKYSGVTKAMAKSQNDVAHGAGARGGPGNRTPAIPFPEVYNVRSYMFDEIEKKEVLHIDRLGADDVARAIEKLAELAIAGEKYMWVWVGGEGVLTMKLTEHWKVRIARDGAVVIKAGDYVLAADDAFLLLSAESSGRYVVVAKGDEITWDGTEEFFSPRDIIRLAKEVARRVLEQARWI